MANETHAHDLLIFPLCVADVINRCGFRTRSLVSFVSLISCFIKISQPENILLDKDCRVARVCDFGFAKHVPSIKPTDLAGDPTTCYQPPERWLACNGPSAIRARDKMSRASVMADESGRSDACSGGECCGVPRRDETAESLFAGDVFSAGVTLFVLVSYHAILARLVTEAGCRDVSEGEESSLPAMNIFQHTAGGELFGLLQARKEKGGVQGRLWAYW